MHFDRLRSSLLAQIAIIVLIGLIAGCTSQPEGATPSQNLFLTVPASRSIVIYPVNAGGSEKPFQVITEKVPDEPMDVTLDGVGEAFVVNHNGNVRIYGPRPDHQYELVRSFGGDNTRLVNPIGIAVNLAGSFYVADALDGKSGQVEWFSGGSAGNLVPDRVIAGPHTGIVKPGGVAIDGSGRLFVSDQATNQVLVFDANADGDAEPLTTLKGFSQPGRLAVDQTLNLYVVNQGDDSIRVLSSAGPQSWTPSATITSKLMRGLVGIAVDATGQIAAGTAGEVLFFASGASGNVDSVRTLQGPSGINPAGMSIH